jgi:hypothetical protein
MPIRGGCPPCCGSTASTATRRTSAIVAGVRLSASIRHRIKFGYLSDDARSNAPRRHPRMSSPRTPASDLSNAAVHLRRPERPKGARPGVR